VSVKAALRSVVFAIIISTGVTAYGFVKAFRWLELLTARHEGVTEKVRELRGVAHNHPAQNNGGPSYLYDRNRLYG
jgi:hypothetical protein